MHQWPIPCAPAVNGLVPRPRVVEVLSGAFTSGPIHGVTVTGAGAKSLTEVDREWVRGVVARARDLLPTGSDVDVGRPQAGASGDPPSSRGAFVDVRLTLLADGDVLPTVVADEHGGVAGGEAYELTLHKGVLAITGKK